MANPFDKNETLDDAQPFRVHKRESDGGGELDMTPMVDVTFLLLIFFMVTAVFSSQESLPMPAPDQKESAAQAPTVEELETDDDYIIIRIERDDTVYVNGNEAPSRQEVLQQLREACSQSPGTSSSGPSNLLVLADGDCLHETVVMALDVGNAVGIEHIRLATASDDDF